MNKDVLTKLVEAGACDCFGESRDRMLAAVSAIADKNKIVPSNDGIGIIFSGDYAELGYIDQLNREKALLHVYVSGHPLDVCQNEIRRQGWVDLATVQDVVSTNQYVTCAAIVKNVKEFAVKRNGPNKGKLMAHIEIEDLTGEMKVTCFANYYVNYKDLLKDENSLLVFTLECQQGGGYEITETVENDEGESETVVTTVKSERNFIVKKIRTLDEASKDSKNPVVIDIPYEHVDKEHIDIIKDICARYSGSCEIDFRVHFENTQYVMQVKDFTVNPSLEFYKDVYQIAN